MLPERHFVTVRDRRDSVWQSVVEQVAKRQSPKRAFASRSAAAKLNTIADLVEAAHAQVYERHEPRRVRIPIELSASTKAAEGVGTETAARVSGAEVAKRCAALAVQLAEAKVFGTVEQIKALQDAFDFNVCDPFWVECVNEYVKYFKLHGGTVPYRAGLNNVLPTLLPSNAKIALFGDWGTGEQNAIDLLKQIKGFNPDILMHLGDVYYSGTQEEMQERFLDVCTSVFGESVPVRFSLSGNHDMYSGGDGYYWLVDQLCQKASYFAIQNNDWIFIAMDTGVHDFKPLEHGAGATYLMPTEAVWVNNLVASRGNKKVVFLSHHPLFSAYDPIGGSAVNTVLLSQITDSLPSISAWFWGHEHRLGIYDEFQGLQRGAALDMPRSLFSRTPRATHPHSPASPSIWSTAAQSKRDRRMDFSSTGLLS